jgi:hypothetical protein
MKYGFNGVDACIMRTTEKWPALKAAYLEQGKKLRFEAEMVPGMRRTCVNSLRELQANRYENIEWSPVEQMDLNNHGDGADWNKTKQLLDQLIASPALETQVGPALTNRMGYIWNKVLAKPLNQRLTTWINEVMPPYEYLEEERRLIARTVQAATNDIYDPTVHVVTLVVMKILYPIFMETVDPAREFRGPPKLQGGGISFSIF